MAAKFARPQSAIYVPASSIGGKKQNKTKNSNASKLLTKLIIIITTMIMGQLYGACLTALGALQFNATPKTGKTEDKKTKENKQTNKQQQQQQINPFPIQDSTPHHF